MAKHGTAYIYKSVREGDRVRRTYLGTLADPVVLTLVESERLIKATHDAEQRITACELSTVETLDRCLQLVHSSAVRLVRNVRKRWRRANQTRVKRPKMPELHSSDAYEMLVADAADGDMDALAELRQLLKKKSLIRGILGDLNFQVQFHLIDLAAGGAIDVKESLKLTLAEQRNDLLQSGDSLPEQLLVDQILSTMLDAAVCQLGHSQQHAKASVARRWERRLTAAQTRHQAAIKSLIELRLMLEKFSD